MNNTTDNNQLSLLAFGGVALTGDVSKVFKHEPIKSPKTGEVIGYSIALQKKSDIAKAHGLKTTDKEGIEEVMLEQSDAAFEAVKREILAMDTKNGYTLHKVAKRDIKGGILQWTTVIRKIKRKAKTMTDEEIAKMWTESTGVPMTAEGIREMREREVKKLEEMEENTVDVNSQEQAA